MAYFRRPHPFMNTEGNAMTQTASQKTSEKKFQAEQDKQLRQVALNAALELHRHDPADAASAVKSAKAFERFLKGK